MGPPIAARLPAQPAWTPAQEAMIMEPYAYLDAQPGKEFRSHLLDAFHVWMPSVASEALTHIKALIRRLHHASLMIDDVEDASDMRRGAPAAHKVFGVAQTINTANYAYFQVLSDVAHWQPRALPALIRELEWLHRGQGLELYWREHATCPTESEYADMVVHKTGGLFRVALCLMDSVADTDAAPFVPLANLLGLLFQIRDDYLNLQPPSACDDITEGKFSFPLIHAVRAAKDATLLTMLQQHTQDPALKQQAVAYMQDVTNSFAYTRDVWQALHTQTRTEIERLERTWGENQAMHRLLDALRIGA